MVILILPVPSGVQPGTFGSGCSALPPLCRQRPTDANSARTTRATVCVRRRPRASITVRLRSPKYECDLCHILRQPGQRRDAAVQGQPERSHLSWQAGLHAKAEASAESESQAGAAGSAAPGPSGGATRPGAACFPDVRGASAGANRARPGRTSGGGGRAGAARGSRRRPRHRMAGDRKPAGREPASRPPAVPAPPPRRCQPRRWAGLTRDPGQDPGVKHQLALENMCCRPPSATDRRSHRI